MPHTSYSPLVSLVIPVYNEAPCLASTVARLHAYATTRGWPYELILASNGSTDATVPLARQLSDTHPIVVIDLPQRAPGLAFAQAVAAARAPYLVSLDADLSSDLDFIDRALPLLRDHAMVIGSKLLGHQDRSPLRVLGSRAYIRALQRLLHVPLSDFSMGAKAYQRAAIAPAVAHLNPWTGYVLELALYLRHHRHPITELDVACTDLRPSRFNILHEGLYRYGHLLHLAAAHRLGAHWIHRAAPPQPTSPESP